MRKLYSLLASLVVLFFLQAKAQTTYDTCRADFEKLSSTASDILTAGFVAIPSDSMGKKPEQICWNFGDSHDTCIQYDPAISSNYFVSHKYDHTGLYNVCVKILYQGGCQAYKCKYIQIGDTDSCSIKFETLNSTSNPLGKYFIAAPWDALGKKPVLLCWDFGDSHDTCIQYSTTYNDRYAVFHAYAHSGSYNACVKVQFENGCESHYCSMVQVGDLADSCSADFEIGLISSTPLGRHFSAITWNNHNKKPAYVCWNFGDQHDTCIQYSSTFTGPYTVDHDYAQPGLYEACVRIVYNGGCEAKKCKVIQVGDLDSCAASFEAISSTSNALGKYFVAKTWNNHNKKPLLICWNFGDSHDTCIQYSSSYTGAYAVFHSYLHIGIYNVCVKIHYDGGCESYYCHAVQVGERDSCSVSFESLSQTSSVLGKYFLPKLWNSSNKRPLLICWNFGDNRDTCIQYSTTYTGSYAVFHRYDHTGSYNVCVKVNYDGGCESHYCHAVQVGEADSCKADFEKIAVSTVNDARIVYYRALPWINHDKKPSQICWVFGDGRDTCISYSESYSGAYTVGHRYDHSGIYEVCVKIIYYGGCDAKKCKIINIFFYNTECRVHLYQIVPSVTSLSRGFYFASGNDLRPTAVCWSFGDGTDTCISVEPNATEIPHQIKHEYPGPGVYRACVRVLFANGCTASDCVEVSIRSLTDLCGGYYTDSLISSATYLFRGFSIHKPGDVVTGYRWTFGDGSSGTGETVTHTYPAAGVYRVCLFITTQKGCETKICNDVRVAGDNQVRLQLSPNPVVNILRAAFYSMYNETVRIRIINASGVVVKEYSRDAVVGQNTWEFDVSGLVSGVYSLVVQSPNQFVSGIFFKF